MWISGNWQLDGVNNAEYGEILGGGKCHFNLLGKLLILSVLSALLINLPEPPSKISVAAWHAGF